MEGALAEAGFREEALGGIIHVAGTNGKGSTCRFTADMLKTCGYKTALFTSPHILKVNERIVFDGYDISDADFDRIFLRCVPLIRKYRLSYFEALTITAFLYFSELKPDFSVIETGMGGRFDSSNVLNVKLPVITAIAKDHAAFLGSNIYRIADEKLAIIKDNKTVMLGMNTPSVTDYIRKALPDKRIILTEEASAKVPAPFGKNLALAENTVKELIGHLPLNFIPVLPPCRLERIGRFVLDGAHNPHGMRELVKSADTGRFGSVLISSTADRDIKKLVALLSPRFRNIVITEIPDNERSLRLPLDIAGTVQEKDAEKALNIAVELAGNADILVSGSLYLCAHIKKLLSD
ncbi:bifunctional folylpolyglutamate synthase/dihydrofolate synthase [Geovibrio thiophilus]|uniref:bifunctional folylpolyglutamate synthase/dihydrofolate synthase n=1 Tax=Geovibrio thiophilus TaxID=139438 RepID=UPI0024C0817E|nr:Mur ligase family protein [Geovibrio thiophilus]